MTPNNSLKGVVGRIVSAFDPLGAGTTKPLRKSQFKGYQPSDKLCVREGTGAILSAKKQ